MQRSSHILPIDVGSDGLTRDRTVGLTLQFHAQALPNSLPFGAGFAEVPDGSTAARSELELSIGAQAVEVGKQLVHRRSIPKGKDKSIPFSRLPLSKEFGQCIMDVQTHRKQRLRELINVACGGIIAVLASRIDRDESYVSRMLYPPGKAGAKPIADKMMLVIEQAFRLPRAWLDMPLGTDLSTAGTLVIDEAHLSGSDRVQEYPSKILLVASTGTGKWSDWPFERVTRAQYSALSKPQRYHVEDTIFVLLGAVQEEPEKSGHTERRVAKT